MQVLRGLEMGIADENKGWVSGEKQGCFVGWRNGRIAGIRRRFLETDSFRRLILVSVKVPFPGLVHIF